MSAIYFVMFAMSNIKKCPSPYYEKLKRRHPKTICKIKALNWLGILPDTEIQNSLEEY